MPTKVSEYLITGVPLLVFSPTDTAVANYISKHECGIFLNNRLNSQELFNSFKSIIDDEIIMKNIIKNAKTTALNNHTSSLECAKFQNLINNI